MELSNEEKWLLVLKEGDVTFDDIKKTIDRAGDSGFDYDKSRGGHAVFHMIINDLDALCRKGEAERAFARENESVVSEVYRITPAGRSRAERLEL